MMAGVLPKCSEPAAVDLELGHWYSHTHPQVHFHNNLMVARATAEGRVTLFNLEFTVRHTDGRTETRPIRTADELLALLAEHFQMEFPTGTRFGAPGAAWPV